MIHLLLMAALTTFNAGNQVKALPQELSVWCSRNVAPSSKIRLNINTRNVPIVHVTSFPIDGLKYYRSQQSERIRPQPVAPPNAKFDLTVTQNGQNTKNDNWYSRQVNLPPIKPGVYLLLFAGGSKQTWTVVNVTNLALLTKRSSTHSLVWVTDHKTGRVISGARVDYFSRKGTGLTSSVTGQDGVSIIPMTAGTTRIIVRAASDIAAVECSIPQLDGILTCLFQTDRPIYRPGQVVSFKAILRLTKGQIYSLIGNQDVRLQFRDPRDNPLEQVTLRSNDIGSVAGSFKIPQEGMIGPYSIVLTTNNQSAYQTFSVAAYRKPEFKVDVRTVGRRYFGGDDIHFSVDSAYYFGSPVAQAVVHWTARRSFSPYSNTTPEDAWFYGGDGNLYPRDTYAAAPFGAEGQAITDNNGHVDIPVHTEKDGMDANYTLAVTVEDQSRRQVQGHGSVPVYASELRISLTPLKQAVAVGDLVPVELRVVDLDNRVQPAEVLLQVIQQVYIEKEGIYRPKVLTSKKVKVPTTGHLVTQLPALAFGSLSLVATTQDTHGRKASGNAEIYVAGMDSVPTKTVEQPRLEGRLDKRTYKPGDQVKVYVTTNRPSRPILMTFTGGDIWNYKVFDPIHKSILWTLDTSTAESPNAYVNFNQWVETQLMSGNNIVPLPDKDKLLNVKVWSDRSEYEPGDKATFHVQTTSHSGKPIRSEVALSIIDEAIYALSPDTTPEPYRFFWGMRPDRVTTMESSPEELSGGAYQRTNSLAPVRLRFEDTAYWNALVQTDGQGQASVSVEMPGNLTTWRATGRAITSDTLVGTGTTNTVATRAVTLRLAVPRIVSQGDEFVLTGTVNNRSSTARKFEVNLEMNGVPVASSSNHSIRIDAKSEGIVKWTLLATQIPPTQVLALSADVHELGNSNPKFSDALKVAVPIVPRGLMKLDIMGGTLTQSESTNLRLPLDTLPQGSLITGTISGGIHDRVNAWARGLVLSGRYGTFWGVNTLKAAIALKLSPQTEEVKEALALLSRTESGDGWGWWEGSPPDAKITSEVAHTLALAKRQGFDIFDTVLKYAMGSCVSQYVRTNSWEDRTRLSASLVELGDPSAGKFTSEVLERGIKVSPFAKMRLAHALVSVNRAASLRLLNEVRPLVSDGNVSAKIPVGSGIGWSATENQTTAEFLSVLNLLHESPELQTRLARNLAVPDETSYRSSEEIGDVVSALDLYGKEHPGASIIGKAEIVINGHKYELSHSSVEESASFETREPILKGGKNDFTLSRTGSGEVFFALQIRTYQPNLHESNRGVRVTRRYETLNAAGVWSEIGDRVKPNEPVRCTVVVWGDDVADALRITEPIPAGFEYVDSDYTANALQQVKDGAIEHYLLNSGTPNYFRYYLRAEADGRLVALPAVAEYLRRPSIRGNSSATELVVHP